MNSTGSEAADGTLATGSADNLRWEIGAINQNTGTFNLSVRRGNDSTKNKVILETFTNLSLDPESENFISLRVGDRRQVVGTDGSESFIKEEGQYANRSSFIRVKEVLLTTPAYAAANSGSLPVASSGSFKDATGIIAKETATFYNNFGGNDIQGVDTGSYATAAAVLANRDEYQFNVLATPGLVSAKHGSTVAQFVSLVEERADAIYVTDLVDFGSGLSTVTGAAVVINSSFAAAYWPFVQVRSATGKNQFVPASTIVPGVYAFSDNLTAPWFAPAGLVRGGIPGVIQAERKLTKSNRDSLYDNNINPIATFPGTGVSILGQKTLQKKASALDRVNVRRLVLELKKFFSEQARNLLFEQNTIATRNRFLAVVNPFMESVVQRQGLFAFRVVMDETNNTADVIDRNQLVGQIFIQPARTAEFIVLDFTIEPTGATFGA
jgi:phage tail sheath protein FI